MNKKELVIIFDLDGTLLDTNELILQSFRHVFKQYMPEKELTKQELISFLGPSLHDTFSRYFDKSLINELIEYYREYNHAHHINYVSVYPTVIETLEYLKKENYYLAIVTTKHTEVAQLGLDLFSLDEYFDCLIGGNSVERIKPDPEGIHKVVTLLNKKHAVMIGDSASDIQAGKNAGVFTIGVDWTFKPIETLSSLQPDLIVSEMAEIISFIEEKEVEINA